MAQAGRPFLQIPGPTPVPERVLRAMAAPTIDHRGPEFAELAREVLAGVREVCGTTGLVIVYPSSGTGAWESALVNTLAPGDGVLAFETGHFATLWQRMAAQLGLRVEFVPGDWRHGVDPQVVFGKLSQDTAHRIGAVTVVHNETSTGVLSRVPEIRAAIDAARHPALLLVDAISSMGSVDYRHDDWGVDVTVWCSQKGMMLPPGLGLVAVGERALERSRQAGLPRSYWDWQQYLHVEETGMFPYTPATNLLYGLREVLRIFRERGLRAIVSNHVRLATATRAAVAAWGLETVCRDPREHSPILTAVLLPDHDADAFRKVALERFSLSLGAGLGRLAGHCFRIGHVGDVGDLDLLGALAGAEMSLGLSGVRPAASGVAAAMARLSEPEFVTGM